VVRVSDAELFALRAVLLAVGAPGSHEFEARRRSCGLIWEELLRRNGVGDRGSGRELFFSEEMGGMPGGLLGYSTHLAFWHGFIDRLKWQTTQTAKKPF